MSLLLSLLVAALVGAGGTWVVKDWKDGAEIARIRSQKNDAEARNSILDAANQQCGTDIASVRQSLSDLAKAVEERGKAAEAAMVEARPKAEKHSRAAAVIKQLPPPVPQDQQLNVLQKH
jgi:hypothetical protein